MLLIRRTSAAFWAWIQSNTLLLFILWSLLLSIVYFGLGPNSYVRIHDTADGRLATRVALSSSYERDMLGYWNPEGVAGTDRLAEGNTVELINLFFPFFPAWLVYGLFLGLQRFVAGYFTFRLTSEAFDAGFFPSLISGLLYSLFFQPTINNQFGGFTIQNGLYLPGLPLLLWAILRIDGCSQKYASLWAFALGALLSLNSNFAFALFVIPVLIYWFLFVNRIAFQRVLLLLGAFYLGWFVFESPEILASFLVGRMTDRVTWTYGFSNFSGPEGHIRSFWRFFFTPGNFYPLAVAMIGLFLLRFRDRRLLALLFFVVSTYLFLFLRPFILDLLPENISVLTGFNFSRIQLTLPFFLVTSAAIGLTHILNHLRAAVGGSARLRYYTALRYLIALSAVVLIAWIMGNVYTTIFAEWSSGSLYRNFFQRPDLIRLSQQTASDPPFRVASIRFGDTHAAYAWAYGLESADGYTVLYPETYKDYWARVIAPLADYDADRILKFNTYRSSRAYLFFPEEPQISTSYVPFDEYYNLDMLSLANVRFIISPLKVEHPDLIERPAPFRADQVAWAQQGNLSRFTDMVSGNYPGVPLYIYENPDYLPRHFLVDQVKAFQNDEQLLRQMSSVSSDELASAAYVHAGDVASLPLETLGFSQGQVEILSNTADEIFLSVQLDGPAILVTTNNYLPYWRAWVDGDPSQIFPVYHTFQGVYLEAGEHSVRLEYAPPYRLGFGP